MSLVLDSSATIALIYADEATDAVKAVFDRIERSGAFVPSLWWLETANALEMGVRRGRISAEFRDQALADISKYPITTDSETNSRIRHHIVPLAARTRLTVYDAAYLELAVRRSLPLATLDNALQEAARKQGVELLGAH